MSMYREFNDKSFRNISREKHQLHRKHSKLHSLESDRSIYHSDCCSLYSV